MIFTAANEVYYVTIRIFYPCENNYVIFGCNKRRNSRKTFGDIVCARSHAVDSYFDNVFAGLAGEIETITGNLYVFAFNGGAVLLYVYGISFACSRRFPRNVFLGYAYGKFIRFIDCVKVSVGIKHSSFGVLRRKFIRFVISAHPPAKEVFSFAFGKIVHCSAYRLTGFHYFAAVNERYLEFGLFIADRNESRVNGDISRNNGRFESKRSGKRRVFIPTDKFIALFNGFCRFNCSSAVSYGLIIYRSAPVNLKGYGVLDSANESIRAAAVTEHEFFFRIGQSAFAYHALGKR